MLHMAHGSQSEAIATIFEFIKFVENVVAKGEVRLKSLASLITVGQI